MNYFRLESVKDAEPVPFLEADHQRLFDYYKDHSNETSPTPESIMLWYISKGWKLVPINRLITSDNITTR